MTSRPASATLAIVAFCATALLVVQHQRVHRRSSRSTNTDTPAAVLSARDRLIGAWVLTSYHVDDSTTGARQYPLGHDAKGIIVSRLSSVTMLYCPLTTTFFTTSSTLLWCLAIHTRRSHECYIVKFQSRTLFEFG
jgi:hypothetical protein